jgi:hypothetical protein
MPEHGETALEIEVVARLQHARRLVGADLEALEQSRPAALQVAAEGLLRGRVSAVANP